MDPLMESWKRVVCKEIWENIIKGEGEKKKREKNYVDGGYKRKKYIKGNEKSEREKTEGLWETIFKWHVVGNIVVFRSC